MLKETGTVVRTREGRVSVRLSRTSRCQGCNACILAGGGAYMLAEAEDPLGVSVGDQVVIESRGPGQIGGSFVVYILPLALFVLGFFAASTIARPSGRSEGIGVAGGLLFVVLYFAAMALYYRRPAAKARAAMRVVRVLRPSGRKADVGRAPDRPLREEPPQARDTDKRTEVKDNGRFAADTDRGALDRGNEL